MNEIQRRAQHAWEWRLFSDLSRIKNHDIWCFSVGLCETAGWVNKDGQSTLKWVEPGYNIKIFKK